MYNKRSGLLQPIDRGCENVDNHDGLLSATEIPSKMQRASSHPANRNAIAQLADLSFIEKIEAEFPFFPRLHRIFAGLALITANNCSDRSLTTCFATPSTSSHAHPPIQVNYSFDDGSNSATPPASQSSNETFIEIQLYVMSF
jgi:hypothetical protein